jgi:thiosulfate dehydrogenase
MGKFLSGLILGLMLIPAGAAWYFMSGHAPVATDAPPMPFEKFLANSAQHATLKKETTQTSPLPASEANLAAGALTYVNHCAMCHGLSSGPVTPAAKGMFPYPPQLLRADETVTDDPPAETFWKAKNGIRLSGMPGFKATLYDDQLWQVSLMLANADKLPPSVQKLLATPPPAAPSIANAATPATK